MMSNVATTTTTIQLRIDTELLAQIDSAAAAASTSRSEWMRSACERRLRGDDAPDPALVAEVQELRDRLTTLERKVRG